MVSIGLALWIGVAKGHVGDIIAGVDVVVPASEEIPLSLEATFGLVVGQDDGSYRWVCHEAVTAPYSKLQPQYTQGGTGEWLATVTDLTQGRGGATMFHSPDGCAWNDVTGLEPETLVVEATFDPDDSQQAYAVTAREGVGGSVMRSTDGGRSWVEDLGPLPDHALHGVMVVDGEVFVTATDGDGTVASLWYRDSAGDWSETAMPALGGLEGVRLRILGVTGDRVYLNVDPLGGDELWRTDRGLTSFTKIFDGQGEILDFAVSDEGRIVPMDFGNRALLVRDDDTFTEVELPPSIGVANDRDGSLVVAELAYLSGTLVSQQESDGSFTPMGFPDDILGTPECLPGTQTADICGPLWTVLEPRLRGFDAPPVEDSGAVTMPPVEPSECGCSSTGPAMSLTWLVVAPLIGFAARRRR